MAPSISWSTTPAPPGAPLRRGRLRERPPPHGAQLRRRGAPHRGAAAAPARLGPERDRQRRQHRRPRLPRPHRLLQRQQVRPDRLDRLALRRGEAEPGARRHGAAGLRRDRGLPGYRAARESGHPLDRLEAGEGRRGDLRVRARRQGQRYVRGRTGWPLARILSPSLVRRVLGGGAASNLTTSTAGDGRTGPGDALYADVIVALALVAVAVVAAVSTKKVRQVSRRFRMLDEISGSPSKAARYETLEAIGGIIVPEIGDICAIDLIEDERRPPGGGAGRRPRRRRVAAGLPARPARCRSRCERRQPGAEPRSSSGERGGPARVRLRRGGPRIPPRPRGPLGDNGRLRARGRLTGMLTVSVGSSGPSLPRPTSISPGSSPAGSRWPSTTPGSSPTWSAPSGHGPRSPRRCSTACCRRRCPTSPAGRSRRPTGPAGAENEVGGDFYDAFRIAGGWMVVIGDVTGRGAGRPPSPPRPATPCAPPRR